jgi:uncharacterized protein
MLRSMGRIVAAGLWLFAGASHAQVVISQVYGSGGNPGATFRSDFIELHNNGTTAVNLSTWSVQYASSTGTSWARTNLNGSIAAGGYFLVKQADGTGTTLPALPTPDSTGTIAMSGTAGKIALVNSQTTLTGSCPLSASVTDFVGYGSATNCSEIAPTANLGNAIAAVRAGNGCTDTGNNSADFATIAPNAGNSASPVAACSGGMPLLAVNDVSAFEGDTGTTTMTFGFGLSAPAGVGGVSIAYTTADGTATAGSDYVANSGTAIIVEGETLATVAISVNGDTTAEPNESFFIRISAATGATISDNEGLGTIRNDDVSVVTIPQIQGSGLTSPLNGAIVTTEGIVTAQKFNNGFFLQAANDDGNPATSEGIFVFTSIAPPATAAVGNHIRVTGTVVEFLPSTNLNQLSITEITTVTSIQVLSSGNRLPAPVALTSADFNSASTPGTAEKFEGMRVSATNASTITGSDGNITESSATATTTGVFQIILSGVARPFREAGLDILDKFPVPGGKNPPRFDHNPERIMVRSRGQLGATAVAIDAEAQITSLVGVMDYFSGVWAVLPDPGALTVSGGKPPLAVSDQRHEDVTIGGFNLLRFFDEVNDSNGAPTLTAAALDKRLTKTSLAICDYLKAPDILGVVEVENLRVLGLLADRINATCSNAPAYVPYLVQGNDQGGINVGFLISATSVGLLNRVEVLEVTQFGKTATLSNPDGSTSLLNDRPPLMLRAILHQNNGATYPVTVIVNHLRSLNGIDDATAGSNGWSTESARVRAKRSQQALFLANLVESRQQSNPNERIVLLGDFNAFEFSDGYADVMGILRSDAVAEDRVLTYVHSPITAPLIDGSELIVDPADRYSYVFDGNAQTLDHVVINEATVLSATNIAVDHARINADFGEHNFGIAGTPIRVSDHDPVRLRISVPAFRSADLTALADSSQVTVRLGETAKFRALVTNNGPNVADVVSVALVFDALVAPDIASPDGWTCTAPVQNAGSTTVTCNTALFDTSADAAFDASIVADSSLGNRDLRMDVSAASLTFDPANASNRSSTSVKILALADLSVRVNEVASPVNVNSTLNFAVNVGNSGLDRAEFASTALVFDALVAPVVAVPDGWSCTAPIQDTNADTTTVTCTILRLESGTSTDFNISVLAGGLQQADWTLRLAAAVTSQILDDYQDNNTAIASVQVRVFTDLDAILFTTTPSVRANDTASFTSRLINNGPATVSSAVGTFTFDALVSPVVLAPAGWDCGAPNPSSTITTVVCTAATLAPQTSSAFDISFIADPALGTRQVHLTAAISSPFRDWYPDNNEVGAVVSVRGTTDVGITAMTITPSIRVGETAVFKANVTNDGPGAANQLTIYFNFSGPVMPSMAAPADWACSSAGIPQNILCTTSSLPVGANAQFQVTFIAGPELSGIGVQMSVEAEVAGDTNGNNNLANASVAIAAETTADLSLRMVGGPYSFIRNGTTSVHSVQLRNIGPNPVSQPVVTFTGNVPLSLAAVNPPNGWTCARGSVSGGFEITCSLNGTLAVSAARIPFILAVVAPSAQIQSSMTLTSTVSSTTSSDPVPINNSAKYTVSIVPR